MFSLIYVNLVDFPRLGRLVDLVFEGEPFPTADFLEQIVIIPDPVLSLL